jgi:hypothetical protein
MLGLKGDWGEFRQHEVQAASRAFTIRDLLESSYLFSPDLKAGRNTRERSYSLS